MRWLQVEEWERKSKGDKDRGKTDASLTLWSFETLCSPQRWDQTRTSYLFVSFSQCTGACTCTFFPSASVCKHVSRWESWIRALSKEVVCSASVGVEALKPSQWRLLFILLCVNPPCVSDHIFKHVWQVCFARITVWCVYESLHAEKNPGTWLHVGANVSMSDYLSLTSILLLRKNLKRLITAQSTRLLKLRTI